MLVRGRWQRVAVGAAVVVGSMVLAASGAGAAGSGGGLAHGPSVGSAAPSAPSHTKSAAGTYELFVGALDLGPLVLNVDHTFQMSVDGETGEWITTGKSLAMSITASPMADIGCTFSATVGGKSLNSAKKPGDYVCPGDAISPWYALKQKPA